MVGKLSRNYLTEICNDGNYRFLERYPLGYPEIFDITYFLCACLFFNILDAINN